MYIKIEKSSFKLLSTNNNLKPIELNLKQQSIENLTLFETIKIKDGKIFNLEFHQNRVNFAFKTLLKNAYPIILKNIIKNYPKYGLYRVKIIYNQSGLIDYSYYIYKKKDIKKIALVELSNINYNYKYENRELFNKLYKQLPQFDDFIITQNGYLKDTTIANIALQHKSSQKWHTPTIPLLRGTTRERYLKDNKLIKKMIHFQDLKNYSKIATLNAMVDFNILKAN